MSEETGEPEPQSVREAFRQALAEGRAWWKSQSPFVRLDWAYTGAVLLIAVIVIYWIFLSAAEAMEGRYLMPGVWALGKSAGVFIVGWWLSGIKIIPVLLTRLVAEKPGSYTQTLAEDVWWSARYFGRVWPAAIAIPAFIVFVGMANMYLFTESASVSDLMATVAVLTVMNSMLILSIGAIALNPIPRMLNRIDKRMSAHEYHG